MKLLIDECLHTSLVDVARQHGHEASHVNWLGLSGATDWGLMPRILEGDFTFVTNNARDFLKLYAREAVHPGLLIIVPQVIPVRQRELLAIILTELGPDDLLNEVVEVEVKDGSAIITRYEMPA